MKLSASREALLGALQAVIGVVERRQTMPILANVMLVAKDNQLSITATDIEVELVSTVDVDVDMAGDLTVPGRKMFEFCQKLPEGATIKLALRGEKVVLQSGPSRATLLPLPAAEFPIIDEIDAEQAITLPSSVLHRLLAKTYFAMAQQDVRYYLNGLLLETDAKMVRAVATDGHRLALCESELGDDTSMEARQVIVPRKGVLELQRLVAGDGPVSISMGRNHIRVEIGSIRFTSK
ncbi:MAG: DNA polymerase III subunit beta, partial [Pseudomonadota bacterium]